MGLLLPLYALIVVFLAILIFMNLNEQLLVPIHTTNILSCNWRPRRRWVDNIRMDLQEVGCGYVDWIGLVQDRDRWRTPVSAVMYLRVP